MEEKDENLPFAPIKPEEAKELAEKILEEMGKQEGATIRDLAGVKKETLEEIYALAYGYYDQGKQKEALSLFQFLAQVAPDTYHYVFGFAAALYQDGQYQDAAAGFYLALTLEASDPQCAFYLADSLMRIGKLEEAQEAFEIAADLCGDNPNHSALKTRCQLDSKELKKKLKKPSES